MTTTEDYGHGNIVTEFDPPVDAQAAIASPSFCSLRFSALQSPMSWFSSRFSTSVSRPSEDREENDNSSDESEHKMVAKGVKDDLSELTRSFTRQIWGVASFLAPPPETHLEQDSDRGSDETSSPSLADGPLQRPVRIGLAGEMTSPNELVDVDFKDSLQKGHDQAAVGDTNGENLGSSLLQDTRFNQGSEDVLTGIGKDLAELKGSVATGLSKFLRVVREEIERDETADHNDEDDHGGDDLDDMNINDSGKQFLGINALLKPLLSSILQGDNMERASSEMVDTSSDAEHEHGYNPDDTLESDKESDLHQNEKSQQVVGVTEEVLTFARNISMHPETWLDFPLFTEDEDDDDFEMSDAQKEHVHQVEIASPRLAALRIELCPDYMSNGRFWKIYFVLLHSRLSRSHAELLSTPQILEARAALLRKLQKGEAKNETRNDGKDESSRSTSSFKIVSLQSATEVPAKDFVEELVDNTDRNQTNGLIIDSGDEFQNKTVLASTVKLAWQPHSDEEADAEKWLDEEPLSHLGPDGVALMNEDDVSFSDLEDEDDPTAENMESKRTFGWVQLNNNVTSESSEILRKGKFNPDAVCSTLSDTRIDQVTRKQNSDGSSDWSTLEDEDVSFT